MFQKFLRWIKFNFRYFGKPLWETGISPPELIDFIRTHQAGRAIDFGAGTGRNMLTLLRAGWEVIGIEYAIRAVMVGRRNLKENGFPPAILLRSVAENLSWIEGKFDLILDIGCFHNLSIKEKATYYDNAIRLLKNGGTFLIYGFSQSYRRKNGITKNDINCFKEKFELVEQKRGTDSRNRPSLWMRFVKKG